MAKTITRLGGVPQFHADGFTGRIRWSASGAGHFIPATSANGEIVTFGSLGGTFNITATDITDAGTAAANGQVLQPCFPFQPTFNASGGGGGTSGSAARSIDQNTQVSRAEDGGESFVEKGDMLRTFTWKFMQRDIAEWVEANAFYAYFRKSKSFWLLDAARSGAGAGVIYLVRFTTPFNDDPGDVDLIDYEFTFVEAVRP